MRQDLNAQACRDAYKRLRAYESRWIDLTYPDGDPRAVKADREMAPDEIDTRDRLRRTVLLWAARAAGESLDAASMFADAPFASGNPYRLERVKLALSLRWDVPSWARDVARRRLESEAARKADQQIDAFQARIEGAV